ncbi:microtubule-associated protein 9 isoform X1 [Alosa pseudoharengus]|uniref:microtubule-associated protein 9 isoform X1 n=1 Tax=Alosa pseudoharengus TaxID=34774 RepID=UPI003F8C4FB3
MSDDDPFRTLAYKKSPKVSKRTTFQDELEAAVSTRARKKNNKEHQSYSDDFDDDDVLTEILNRRKKKLETFRKGNKQGKVQEFQLSDEEENARPKRVSFLKSRKTSSPVDVEKGETEKTGIHSALNESSQSTLSSGKSESGHHGHSVLTPMSEGSPHDPLQLWQDQSETSVSPRGQSESPMEKRDLSGFSPQWGPSESIQSHKHFSSRSGRSDSSASTLFHPDSRQGDSLSPPLSKEGLGVVPDSTESSEHDKTLAQGPQNLPLPHPRERSVKEKPTADISTEEGPPKPKPRQKMRRAGSPTMEERPGAEGPSSPTLSSKAVSQSPTIRAGTSSSSSSGKRGPSRGSPQVVERDPSASSKLSRYSSSAGDGMSLPKSTEDSSCNNGLEETEEVKGDTYSVNFEEYEESADRPDGAVSQLSNTSGKIDTIRPSSAQPSSSKKSGRVSSRTAKSKYLGSLQVLDKQLLETDSQPEATSLRAAVYQEWLQKKQEKLREELKAKRHEEKLKEEKKREEQQTKREVATASFEAWKEKKRETITDMVKEKQEALRKKEREKSEKEEKKETAKKCLISQVFEKWKQEQDEILKERIRKQTQTENKLKQKKEMDKEERKKDASAAFSKWSETKKDVIQEKTKTERRKEEEKQEEERYEKEEKDQLALEMYEKWMKRKEFQLKREKNEKRIQAILQDEPRPAWSPPNKTVPFGK